MEELKLFFEKNPSWTQGALAEEMRVHRCTLVRWLKGFSSPRPSTRQHVLATLTRLSN